MWSSGARKLIGRCSRQGGLPLTTATREAVAASKASLMDRVRSLEDRLLQVILSSMFVRRLYIDYISRTKGSKNKHEYVDA